MLPFQLVEDTKWYTGLIFALINFILLEIIEIGNEIENSFGYDLNDLPLNKICTTISNNIEDLIVLDAKELSSVDNWQATVVE